MVQYYYTIGRSTNSSLLLSNDTYGASRLRPSSAGSRRTFTCSPFCCLCCLLTLLCTEVERLWHCCCCFRYLQVRSHDVVPAAETVATQRVRSAHGICRISFHELVQSSKKRSPSKAAACASAMARAKSRLGRLARIELRRICSARSKAHPGWVSTF